jgi:DNA-binding CsgD family transcriptional regulator
MSDQQRVIDWLDDVLAWLREPLTVLPVDRVMARLREAYDVNVVSWTEQQGALMTQMIFDQPRVLHEYAGTVAEFMAGEYRDCHPLSAWYERTASCAPQTASRVPYGLVPRNRREILVTPLINLGLDQQMAIYHRRDGVRTAFFVVARDRRDFDDDDLLLARYVQRSLVTLDLQSNALNAGGPARAAPRSSVLGLTGRELAVLQLLCDGFSTRQSARQLACSPRTVEKHLQNAYRKLEVRDRVNAIKIATLAGAVVDRSAVDPTAPSA